MRLYMNSKPPLVVDCDWIYWSRSGFKCIDPDSNKNAALLFVMRRKEIEIIYKPTPVVDDAGNLQAILGNMLDDESTPAIIKIDADEVESCFTIQFFWTIQSRTPIG
jgi:hypothetical protein